jgi:hypothetical protein
MRVEHVTADWGGTLGHITRSTYVIQGPCSTFQYGNHLQQKQESNHGYLSLTEVIFTNAASPSPSNESYLSSGVAASFLVEASAVPTAHRRPACCCFDQFYVVPLVSTAKSSVLLSPQVLGNLPVLMCLVQHSSAESSSAMTNVSNIPHPPLTHTSQLQ